MAFQNWHDSNCTYTGHPRKGTSKERQANVIVIMFSTNGNVGNIAIVNEDLKNCL